MSNETLDVNGGAIVYRLAQPRDRNQIISNFPDVYFGKDYVPALIDHFLAHPDRYIPCVAVKENTVVAFCMAQRVDGGRASVEMAGRTHPDWRHLGLGKKIEAFVFEETRRLCPLVTTTRFTSDSSEYYLHKFQRPSSVTSSRLLGTLSSIQLQVSVKRLCATLDDVGPTFGDVDFTDSTGVSMELITRPRFRQFVFSDILVLHCMPYHVIEGSDDIRNYLSHPTVRMSYTKRRPRTSQRSPLGLASRAENAAMCQIIKCPAGVFVACDTFGCDSGDILNHLLFQLKKRRSELQQGDTENVGVSIYSPVVAPLRPVLKTLIEDCGFQRISEYDTAELLVMEDRLGNHKTNGESVRLGSSKL